MDQSQDLSIFDDHKLQCSTNETVQQLHSFVSIRKETMQGLHMIRVCNILVYFCC
jgi:hypothetical protein